MARTQRRPGAASPRRAPRYLAPIVALVLTCLGGVAWAYTIYQGGTRVSPDQINQWAQNSSVPSIRDNPGLVTALAGYESAGTYNTGVFNGSCCTGLFQFSNGTAQAYGRQFGVSDRYGFATLSGEQQFKAYEQFYSDGLKNTYTKQLLQKQANGETLGGKPIDQSTILACIQLGPENCREAQRNNCSSKENHHGGDGSVSICGFADNLRNKNGGNGGKTDPSGQGSGCTTPTDPKAATTPGNIGAGDGSGNTTTPGGTTTGGGGTDSTRTGGGTSGGTTTSGTPETPSKSVPCKSAESKATDKTSKTCQPTMQMINALQCSNFPASIQSFCQQYKPKLMTSEECTRAEKMAEKEKKGERQTECENQTFATPGTSAWSYVLACSFTQKNQGTFGSATQASGSGAGSSGSSGSGQPTTGSGVASDPQCVERLKKRIPNLKVLGAVETHGNGMTCGVKSGVSWTEISGVPTGYLEGECGMAEKFADFVDAMKAKGVTKMTNIGSFDKNCRWIRNSKGTIVGKVSRHAYGQAIDINGFVSGGQMMSTGKYWSDPTIKAYMSGVRQVACGIFEGVLGPIFYAGKYTHFHLQVGQRTRCDPPP